MFKFEYQKAHGKQGLIASLFMLASVFFSAIVPADASANARASEEPQGAQKMQPVIVLHGGAGTLMPAQFTPQLRREYLAILEQALRTGYKVLEKGGNSIDAVKHTIVVLEDSPLFNAGKGSVFTHDGTNELDASIMFGKDRSAGAVAGVSNVKNPILLADTVRTQSVHVMMSSRGAEQFAKEHQLTMVEPKYFYTQRRWDALQKAQGKTSNTVGSIDTSKFGTVGVVALDHNGDIAAGTSTGGMTNKRYGRIGDSPIIGAGTYANKHCGVSATGHGEYFIRVGVARDICALVEYQGLSIQQAADRVIHTTLTDMGGTGGVVGLDSAGNIMMSFNTPGMYRASLNAAGELTVKIFSD